MAQNQKQQKNNKKFTWVNQKQYPQSIKKMMQPINNTIDPKQQQKQIVNFMQKIKERSKLTLVYLNKQTKQSLLLSQSVNQENEEFENDENKLKFGLYNDNIKNMYKYGFQIFSNYGNRGFGGKIFLINNHNKKYPIKFSIQNILSERISNHYVSNNSCAQLTFKIPLWYTQNSYLSFSRSSRQNSLNIKNKKYENQIYLDNQTSNQILKNSNLNKVSLKIFTKYFNLQNSIGFDYGNKSYFHRHKIDFNKIFSVSQNKKFILRLQGMIMNGKNLMKNDQYPLSQGTYMGRTTNYLSPRLQFHLLNYPISSLIKLNPYIYCQSWMVFLSTVPVQKFKIYGQYGIGIQNVKGNINYQFSLFKINGTKQGGMFHSINFNFQ